MTELLSNNYKLTNGRKGYHPNIPLDFLIKRHPSQSNTHTGIIQKAKIEMLELWYGVMLLFSNTLIFLVK